MTIKERLKRKIRDIKQSRRESKAFESIVQKRTLQARRQAYEKAAIERARGEGKTLATRGTKVERLGSFITNLQGQPVKQPVRQLVQAPIKRRRKVSRKKVKRVTKRKARRKPRRKTKRVTNQGSQQSSSSVVPSLEWGF